MPNTYDRQTAELQRRRQIADALRASGNEALPDSLHNGGRFDAPVSGWQYANKALEQLLAGYQGYKINKDEKKLQEDQAAAQADALRGIIEGQQPSALRPVEVTGQLMDTGGDMSPLASKAELDPLMPVGGQAPVGLQQQMARALRGQQQYATDEAATQASDKQRMMSSYLRGIDVGGVSEALGLAGLQREVFPPAEKVDRVDLGDRIGVYKNGKLAGYEKKGASPDAAATLEANKLEKEANRLFIEGQGKLNRDQALMLAREQMNVTKRGQDLTNERADAARSGAGQKAVDQKFGKEYADYVSGGAATQQQALEELKAQSKALETTQASGPVLGAMWDFVRKRVAGPGFNIQQNIERNIQASLRQTLGAQYTEKEGVNLLARTFDPSLDESINKARLDSLVTKLQRAKDEKDRAAEYFKTNGTLAGYDGKTSWATTDFEPEEAPPAADLTNKATAAQAAGPAPEGVDPALWNAMPPEDRALWPR